MNKKVVGIWKKFQKTNPQISQFLVFFLICNGITVFQIILMPLLKWGFGFTSLKDIGFQWLQIGHNLNGSDYFVFDYSAGSISDGGGGGLAYFLAVEITMAVAQVINFITQRSVTFKSSGNVWRAARWYVLAYLIVTIGAAALQGVYKVPVYRFFMDSFGPGFGNTLADFAVMLINCSLSFWVFYPIMKWIFKK